MAHRPLQLCHQMCPTFSPDALTGVLPDSLGAKNQLLPRPTFNSAQVGGQVLLKL